MVPWFSMKDECINPLISACEIIDLERKNALRGTKIRLIKKGVTTFENAAV